MNVHLVTFSDESMIQSLELCYLSARQNGIHIPHLCDIESVRRLPCYEANRSLFESPRGSGYWAWKPALLHQIMGEEAFVQNVREGDVIVYADAGVEFINNVNYIIDRMDQDIFLFGNNYEHAHWCKADVVRQVRGNTFLAAPDLSTEQWCREFDDDTLIWRNFGKQVQASVIFFRVSDYSRKFVKEWLDWCLFEGGRLIDDSPSRTPNHPEFREHRHDQAILTTLAYREGIKLHYWPAQYNDGAFTYEKIPEYAGDDYPILFHHHRKRNHEWKQCA